MLKFKLALIIISIFAFIKGFESYGYGNSLQEVKIMSFQKKEINENKIVSGSF